MLTDPVNDGKSMHGLIDMIRSGRFLQDLRVRYAHLGGVPELSAYRVTLRSDCCVNGLPSRSTTRSSTHNG